MKKRKTPDLEKYLEGKKRRFVNYTQGAKIYKMSYWPFVRLAKKAEANYPIRKIAIVDLNILDDFLEGNPEVVSELKKRRKKVLLIDADPQGSLTASLGYVEPDELGVTLATIMTICDR